MYPFLHALSRRCEGVMQEMSDGRAMIGSDAIGGCDSNPGLPRYTQWLEPKSNTSRSVTILYHSTSSLPFTFSSPIMMRLSRSITRPSTSLKAASSRSYVVASQTQRAKEAPVCHPSLSRLPLRFTFADHHRTLVNTKDTQ